MGEPESAVQNVDREVAEVDTTFVMSSVPEPEPQPMQVADPLRDRLLAEAQILAGAERCYAALKSKDVTSLTELYHPATASDRNTLKKLSRLLQTREWSADVGERVDGNRRIGIDRQQWTSAFR